MMKKILLILSLFVFGACDLERIDEGPQAVAKECKGEAKYNNLEEAGWIGEFNNRQLELRFESGVMDLRYACSLKDEKGEKTYTEEMEDMFPYIVRGFQELDLASPRILSVHIEELKKDCHFRLTQKMGYSFQGSCLRLEDEEKQVYFLRAFKK